MFKKSMTDAHEVQTGLSLCKGDVCSGEAFLVTEQSFYLRVTYAIIDVTSRLYIPAPILGYITL